MKPMDPDATLQEIRRIIQLNNTAGQPDSDGIDGDEIGRLFEYVEALDNWITGGGFIPTDWGQ
jgi:hypothetical protein